ncbi:DUF4974 domain-containing protein [Pedobacter ginsengiterrae]|uniref:DUF4974 domain-containing protein n=1 Tax=Pedobacter ginsengiterrae TaxID=871696 RepID=A0ABP7NN20_9SPHI
MEKITQQKKYELLANKWQEGTCTNAEQTELFEYYEQFGANKVEIPIVFNGNEDLYRDALYKKISNRIEIKRTSSVRLWLWSGAAAVVFILSAVLINFKINSTQSHKLVKSRKLPVSKNPIQKQPILIQNNGSVVQLRNAEHSGVQNGFNVQQDNNGTLVYTITKNKIGAANDKILNEIRTPVGQKLIVFLSDGTKVHLNAGSSFKFPNQFQSAIRRVSLVGEAYFEVSKDKTKPFIVSTANQDIEVLGTHFNVNAYENEAASRTTLVEGRVKIKPKFLGKSTILLPGQQAVLENQNLTVAEVNTETALAWRSGYFIFNNEDLESIMRKLQRWYGIDVIYRNQKNPELTFAGAISQEKSLTSILKIIEETGDVRFSVSGRSVTVLK